ncbi:MAG TPA: CPBP family intramembrane glutamic endopeptidase [Kofleriaceae bacterium]
MQSEQLATHRARAFMSSHPVLTYFLLTFAISWGGILIAVGPTGIIASKQVFESYVWVPPLVLGPCIAGILTTWLVAGRAGLRDYRSRLLKWRVGARWYAVALLAAPVYYLATALVLSMSSRDFLPGLVIADDKATFMIQGTIVALSAGIFEELGWTGFAIPALMRRHTPLATGVLVGLVWGLWHVLPEILGASAFELMPYLLVQLLLVIVGLTGFRILMVWVYEHTHSTLIGILMHASLTASMMMLQPLVIGKSLVLIGIVLAIVPWLIVAAVLLVRNQVTASHDRGSRPEPARLRASHR